MQSSEVVSSSFGPTLRCKFQDLPFDIFMLIAEYTLVRETLLLGTLNRTFHEYVMPDNITLWRLFTERVYLLHPSGLKQMLFNDSIMRMYAAVNSIPPSLILSGTGNNLEEIDNNDNNNCRLPLPRLTTKLVSQTELLQWVTDCFEEVIQDLRMFSDIIKSEESRLALSGLLMALQAVKKRMWCTEVTDLESVRDLLRATIVEDEHDQGWSVLSNICGRGRIMPKRFYMSLSMHINSTNVIALQAERQMLKTRWKRAAAVAREYLQLREVLRVVLAVSEVSDHPSAKQRYDSVWSALCGTSAMLNAEKKSWRSQSRDLDEVGAAIPMSASGDELLQRIRDLNKVTVGGIVSYFFGYVSGKAQRKTFLSALFSMKHLAGADCYKGVPFW